MKVREIARGPLPDIRAATARAPDLPAAMVGTWKTGNAIVEIRSNGLYFVRETGASCDLSENGLVLNFAGVQFDRTYGASDSVVGVWRESVDRDELILRADGTYTWGAPEFALMGEYVVSGSTANTVEARAVISALGNEMSWHALYMASCSHGTWTATEEQMTWVLPMGTIVFERM